jgi:exodeoxyribonuclease V alpha subunit
MTITGTKQAESRPHRGAEHLSGLIERVTFHSEESGFCVLRVKTRGHRDHLTVVGTVPQVRAGEWIEAEGQWTVNRDHGPQFKAEILRTTAPATAEGIEKYLASGLIKGIGPAFSQRLVKHFGTNVLDVIESTPDRLLEVDGIGPVRYSKITTAWAEQKVVRNIMVFLHSHGVSTSRAFRIYKTYGAEAIEKVSENPYCLARDIRGIGFKTADKIAESLGIGRQSEQRAQAGIEYVLQELTNEGHCGCPRDALIKAAVSILKIPDSIVESSLGHVLQEERIVEHHRDADSSLIYLAALNTAEQKLAAGLADLSAGNHPCPDIKTEKAIQWVEKKVRLQLAKQQYEAIQLACQSKFMVITGGPGVGKTTVVNAIVKIMQAKALTVVLAAPTGRAAKRMTEATEVPAKTIHRLLEFDPATSAFKHDTNNKLQGDVFIIDETSMLDVVLAYQLVRAIPQHAALILVGDVDQLPSVGPGCVLRDIIDSNVFPVCRLSQVFRQAAQSAIVTNAHRVNHGEMPLFPKGKAEQPEVTDCYFIEAEDPEKALSITVHLACEAISNRFSFDHFNDI